MARIGIDGTALAPDGKGISRYLFEILWALSELPVHHDFYIFVNRNAPRLELPNHPRFHYVPVRIPSSLVWEQFLMPGMAGKFTLHLFHTPLDRIPLFLKIPVIMYLFETPDVRNRLLHSEERSVYDRLSRTLTKGLFPRSLKKAARILVSSQSTGTDLETRYHVHPDKIRLVYPGANSVFCPASSGERDRIRLSLDLPEGYLLHFSSDDPRDNTLTVLEAYAKAGEALSDLVPLVIGGTIRRFRERLLEKAKQLQILDRIKLTGFKRGKELVRLYQGATAYFDPSLFEGFGFQVAEAMACGLPVITSNVSSLPELVPDGTLTAPPLDVASFSAALVRVFSDRALAKQMSEKSLLESKKFSWKRHAEETIQVFDEVLGNHAG